MVGLLESRSLKEYSSRAGTQASDKGTAGLCMSEREKWDWEFGKDRSQLLPSGGRTTAGVMLTGKGSKTGRSTYFLLPAFCLSFLCFLWKEPSRELAASEPQSRVQKGGFGWVLTTQHPYISFYTYLNFHLRTIKHHVSPNLEQRCSHLLSKQGRYRIPPVILSIPVLLSSVILLMAFIWIESPPNISIFPSMLVASFTLTCCSFSVYSKNIFMCIQQTPLHL